MTAHAWLYLFLGLVGLYATISSAKTRKRRRSGKKYRVIVRRGPRIATKEQRQLIYRRDGGVCHYCALIGRTTKVHPRSSHRRGRWSSCYACGEIDHVHPHVKGGKTVLSNLILACYECNRAKGTKSYDEFVRSLNRRGAHRPRARGI